MSLGDGVPGDLSLLGAVAPGLVCALAVVVVLLPWLLPESPLSLMSWLLLDSLLFLLSSRLGTFTCVRYS